MAHDRLIPTVPMPVLPSAPSSIPESQYATRDYVMEWYRRLSDRVDGIVAGSSTPATRETLGGVIIGDGVDVDAEGRISVSEFTPTDEQQKVLTSGITSEKVSAYDGYAKSKQDTLNTPQLKAVNSGITKAKVEQYDGTLDDRRVVISGLDGKFYTMTVLADGRLQLSGTDDPGVGGWMPPEIDLIPYDRKYSLVAATIADGTVALQDRAVNAIRLGSDTTECTFMFPDRIKGKARDFMLRLELVGEEMPTLSFIEPDGSHVNFDYTDEDWAAVEQGVNVFMFSDTKEGE